MIDHILYYHRLEVDPVEKDNQNCYCFDFNFEQMIKVK